MKSNSVFTEDKPESIFGPSTEEPKVEGSFEPSLELVVTKGTEVGEIDLEEKKSNFMGLKNSPISLDFRLSTTTALQNNILNKIASGDSNIEEDITVLQNESSRSLDPSDFYNGVVNKFADVNYEVNPKTLNELDKQALERHAQSFNDHLLVIQALNKKAAEFDELNKNQFLPIWIHQSVQNLMFGDTYFDTRGLGTESILGNITESPDSAINTLRKDLFNSDLPLEQKLKSVEGTSDLVLSETNNIFDDPGEASQIIKDIISQEDTYRDWEVAVDLALLTTTAGIGNIFKGGYKAAQKQILKATNPGKYTDIAVKATQDFVEGRVTPSTEIIGSVEEAVQEALPQGLTGINNPIAGKVAEAFDSLSERGQLILEELARPALRPEEADAAAQSLTKQLRTSEIFVRDSGVVPHDNLSSISDYFAILGKSSNNGWTTREEALEYASKYTPEQQQYMSVHEKDGGYLIKYQQPLNPNKYSGRLTLETDDVGNLVPYLNDLFGNARKILADTNDFFSSLGDLARTKQEYIAPLLKDINDNITKGKVRKAFDLLLKENQNTGVDGKWFEDAHEFRSAWESSINITEKYKPEYWNVYKNIRELSDFSYLVGNQKLYDEMISNGYKTIDLDGFNDIPALQSSIEDFYEGKTFGKIISPDAALSARVYNPVTGKILSKAEVAKLGERGTKFYKFVAPTHVIAKNFKGATIIADTGRLVKEAPLDKAVLPYASGGRRIPRDSYILQQANLVDDNILLKPRTLLTGTSKEAMERATKILNNIQENYKLYSQGAIDRTTLVQRVAATGAKREPEELLRPYDDGKWDYNRPVELKRNDDPNKDIPSVEKLKEEYGNYRTGIELDDELLDLADTYSLYNMKRGQHLKDLDGNLVSTLDNVDAVDRSLRAALDDATIRKATSGIARRWAKTFMPDEEAGMTLSDILTIDVDKLKLPKNRTRLAKFTQEALKRFLGRKSAIDRYYDSMISNFGYTLNKVNTNIPADIFKGSVLDRDVTSALKGLAFNLAMGFFTPHHLLIQPQQAAIILTSAAPLNPLKQVDLYKRMARVNYLEVTTRLPYEDVRKGVIKHIANNLGDNADEIILMHERLRESGIKYINDNISQLDQNASSLIKGRIGRAGQWVQDKGTIFFDMAEYTNRLAAFTRAYDELGFDSVKGKLTDLQYKKLRDTYDKYNVSMESSRLAANQQEALGGIASLSTQFMSYAFRFAEAMLPKKLGGDPRWTGKEKAELVGTYFAMYGTNTLPFGLQDLTIEAMNQVFGSEPSDLKILAHKGLIDYFLGKNFGVEIGASAVATTVFEDLLAKLNGDHNTSTLEIAAGAVGGIVFENVFKLTDLYLGFGLGTAIYTEEGFTVDTAKTLVERTKDVAINATTLPRNLRNAAEALESGQVLTARSDIKADNVTSTQAVLQVLGAKPTQFRITQENYVVQLDYKEAKTRAFRDITSIMNEEETHLIKAVDAFNRGEVTAHKEYLAEARATRQMLVEYTRYWKTHKHGDKIVRDIYNRYKGRRNFYLSGIQKYRELFDKNPEFLTFQEYFRTYEEDYTW